MWTLNAQHPDEAGRYGVAQGRPYQASAHISLPTISNRAAAALAIACMALHLSLHDLDIMDKHTGLLPDGTINADLTVSLVTGELDSTDGHSYSFTMPPGTALSGRELIPALEDLMNLCEGILEAFADLQLASSFGLTSTMSTSAWCIMLLTSVGSLCSQEPAAVVRQDGRRLGLL